MRACKACWRCTFLTPNPSPPIAGAHWSRARRISWCGFLHTEQTGSRLLWQRPRCGCRPGCCATPDVTYTTNNHHAMTIQRKTLHGICALLLFSALGCAASNPQVGAEERASATENIASLVDHLRARALNIQFVGPPPERLSSVDAEQYTVNGDPSIRGQLILYQFAIPSEARRALGEVRRQRSVNVNVTTYLQDTLVAVYFGENLNVKSALRSVMQPR